MSNEPYFRIEGGTIYACNGATFGELADLPLVLRDNTLEVDPVPREYPPPPPERGDDGFYKVAPREAL